MRWLRRSTRRDREGGAVTLELIGMAPVALVFGALALQVGSLMWGITSTSQAVRQGARASSLGQDGCSAARDTLADSLVVLSCSSSNGGQYGHDRVSMRVRVKILPGVDDLVPDVVITRRAELP